MSCGGVGWLGLREGSSSCCKQHHNPLSHKNGAASLDSVSVLSVKFVGLNYFHFTAMFLKGQRSLKYLGMSSGKELFNSSCSEPLSSFHYHMGKCNPIFTDFSCAFTQKKASQKLYSSSFTECNFS